MKFIIDVFELQAAVKALGIVAKSNLLDEAGKILIKAEDDIVTLSANNGSVSISKFIKADVLEPGTTSTFYGKMKSFVMSYSVWDGTTGAQKFTLVSDDRNISISTDNKTENNKNAKGSLKLACFNPATIPPPPTFGEESFYLKSNIIRAATNKIMYAIDSSIDARITSMRGMNVLFHTDYIYFAGTNGRVVSEYQVKNVSNMTDNSINFAFDFVMGLKRLLADDINISFDVKGSRVVAKFDNTLFSGRLIVGETFPDYKPIFEKYTDYLNLNKLFLVESLSTILDMLDPEDNFRVTLAIENNMFKMYNEHANVESDQGIQGGYNYSVDVNGRLLLQTLDAINDDYVLFKFSKDGDIIIFDSSAYNDQKALIVSMRKR